jgi:ABC-type glycerol-3-phosphate transport system substrate-binding protein
MSNSLTSKGLVLALAVAGLAACSKPAAQVAASGSDQAVSSTAPVHWDMASNDPAKNPVVANKESASTPGFNP